jgi:hypothetical protein
MATGNQNLISAVQSGNQDVISALNSGNTTLANQIAAGTAQTTGAISNLSNQVASGNTALQAAINSGNQALVSAVQSGNTSVINALNSGNTTLANQIANSTATTQAGLTNVGQQVQAGTQATTGAIGNLSNQVAAGNTALQAAINTGDQNVVSAVQAGNSNVISALNSGNSALASAIAAGTAATTSGLSSLNASIAAQTAAQNAAATKAAAAQKQTTLQQNAQNVMQSGTGTTGGIQNLTGNVTKANENYTLAGLPTIQEGENALPVTQRFATGGSTTTPTSFIDNLTANDPFNQKTTSISSSLKPSMTKANTNYTLTGLPGNLIDHKAAGGYIHQPSFYSEGGLGSLHNRYVQGPGDGTSDSVPAMLANGEFVIPADVVSKLGNGSNDAGAGVLDQFLKTIRTHAQANGSKLPPKSKGPLAYLLDVKRKVKA